MLLTRDNLFDAVIGGLVWSASKLVKDKYKNVANAAMFGGMVWALGFVLRKAAQNANREHDQKAKSSGIASLKSAHFLIAGTLFTFIAISAGTNYSMLVYPAAIIAALALFTYKN